MSSKFIISGGGTGGHIFPAIAIANGIKSVSLWQKFCLLVPKDEWK